jgi:citrate lyase beta subunit
MVPGASRRMIEHAAACEADEVVIDLEDSVSPDRKARARRTTASALASVPFRAASLTVRVNALTSPECLRDVERLLAARAAGARLDCLMLPKVNGVDDIHYLEHLIGALEQELSHSSAIGFVVQIETARGVLAAAASAKACGERLEAIAFGPGDYAADLGVPAAHIGSSALPYPAHQWHWVMSELSNCARATGAQAIDGPWGDPDDRAGFMESAQMAIALGYDGKHCIHPRQVPWANEAFSPTADQIQRARQIQDAISEARRRGLGATSVDGKMIDEASWRLASRILARAGQLAGPDR